MNKGEWSELLVGLLLLQHKECHLYKTLTVMEIQKMGFTPDKLLSFEEVDFSCIDYIKKQLSNSKNKGSFDLPKIKSLKKKTFFKKGTSFEKDDLTLQYRINNVVSTHGFGVKSMLGSSPTLLNASQATNFIFKVPSKYKDSKDKTKVLLQNIPDESIVFKKCSNEILQKNLKMIDSSMDRYLAKILISYYKGKHSKIIDLINCSFPISEVACVKKRFSDFLYYSCTSFFPSKVWDGMEKSIGCIFLKKDFSLFSLHRIEINQFKNFLLLNSKLDTPSTSRHHFGTIYTEDKEHYIKLNLQIRLLSKIT